MPDDADDDILTAALVGQQRNVRFLIPFHGIRNSDLQEKTSPKPVWGWHPINYRMSVRDLHPELPDKKRVEVRVTVDLLPDGHTGAMTCLEFEPQKLRAF